jgi:phage FluMu protein Com
MVFVLNMVGCGRCKTVESIDSKADSESAVDDAGSRQDLRG